MSAYDKLKLDFPELKLPRFGIECHEGWYEVIHFAFQVYNKARELGEVEIQQVKEKFGTLRIYAKTPPAFRHKTLLNTLLEIESMNTCDLCGNPGEWNKGFGWVATRCKEHTGYRGRVNDEIPAEVSSALPSFERDLFYVKQASNGEFTLSRYRLPDVMKVEDFFKDVSEFDLVETVTIRGEHLDKAKDAIVSAGKDESTVVEYDSLDTYNAVFCRPATGGGSPIVPPERGSIRY